MEYIIDQFMWGYQQYYQISLQLFADRLIGKLGPYFNPKVFLIGVLNEEVENRHDICLEPEDCGYTQKDFKDVKELARQLESVDPDKDLIHSHPLAQKGYEIRIKKNALREAIRKIIDRKNAYFDTTTFVSYPTEKEGFLIFTIVQISKSAYDSHYKLNKDKYDNRYYTPVSLINACIDKFLEISAHELNEPNATGVEISKHYGTDDVITSAGKDFMYTVSSKGENFSGLGGLFESCNVISSIKYEGREGIGGLIIAPKEHKNIKMSILFENPIKLNEYRKVRKCLELLDEKTFLVSDSYLVYGIGQINGKYNSASEDLFVINFTSHYHWEVSHSGNSLMKVGYNQAFLPKTKISQEKFYSDLKRIFTEITKTQIDYIWSIMDKVMNQKHGTILVITKGAYREAKRLANQSISIEPTKLNDELLYRLTGIDGSILLSPCGTCYAIGVILDGIATEKGDSSRGARYNSAIRYYEFIKNEYPTLVVIISEDGMIDVIPDLMPQIKHSLISDKIENLRVLATSQGAEFKDFNLTMDWLKRYEFYLSEEQCDEINDLRVRIENNFENKLGTSYLRIVREDLKPNPEMNESYFIKV